MKLRQREPVVRGRPLTYWLEPERQQPRESPETVAEVIAEMDDRSVAFLVRQLEWEPPSRLAREFDDLASRLFNIRPFSNWSDKRVAAAAALEQLGPRAELAIPPLKALATNDPYPATLVVPGVALAALIRLGQEPLEPHLGKLLEPSSKDGHICGVAMYYLGTNAAPAVPLLVKVLEKSSKDWEKGWAVCLLATIRSRPELTVPALASALPHTNPSIRRDAVEGLGRFGPSAKPAWGELLDRLDDPGLDVRAVTTNALRQIDPEAARQLGLN